jgi:type II secretory pathway component PulF
MNYVQMWLFMTNQSEPLRQTSLLMLLAGGIGHGDTLLQCLKSHETESHGHWASKVGQLRLLMEQGHTLSSALAIVRDLLPDQTISAIRTAESTGTLPDVLIDEAKRISGSIHASRASGINPESLLLMTLVLGSVIFVIVSFLGRFIVPKLKEIFIGFGTELPNATVSLIRISDFVQSDWYLFLLPVSALVFAGFWWIYTSSSQRLRLGYHRLMEHWPRYWLPGLLRQLSLSAATGQPLGTALDIAMMDIPPGRAARKISELRHRVTGGEDTIVALASVGLLSRKEAAFLRSSLRTRHLDWGLRHLAQSIEQRRGRWARRIPEILGPIVILFMGLIVLFVCIAFFMPLIKLLNDLS